MGASEIEAELGAKGFLRLAWVICHVTSPLPCKKMVLEIRGVLRWQLCGGGVSGGLLGSFSGHDWNSTLIVWLAAEIGRIH